jgi:hypothetical protein
MVYSLLDNEKSIYRFYITDSNGIKEETGYISYEIKTSLNSFNILLEKEIVINNNKCIEKFETKYKDINTISAMQANSSFGNQTFQLLAMVNKKQLIITENIDGQQRKQKVPINTCFHENNTFPYILPCFLGDFSEKEFSIFSPPLLQFFPIKVTKYNHIEEVVVTAGKFNCIRVKLELVGSTTITQFVLYCCETGRMIKGSSNNQVYELEKIHK